VLKPIQHRYGLDVDNQDKAQTPHNQHEELQFRQWIPEQRESPWVSQVTKAASHRHHLAHKEFYYSLRSLLPTVNINVLRHILVSRYIYIRDR
jgi:hypothetical protein